MKKILIASIISIALVTATQAAVEKHDVCHYEGNGNYHIINISYKAVSAHTNHGDALPGEPVPTNPGFVFDENCEQVAASACPCDFSATGLAEVGLDGSLNHTCSAFMNSVLIQLENSLPNAEAAVINFGDGYCSRYAPDGWDPIESHSQLSEDEINDCADDLRSYSEDLNVICN